MKAPFATLVTGVVPTGFVGREREAKVELAAFEVVSLRRTKVLGWIHWTEVVGSCKKVVVFVAS